MPEAAGAMPEAAEAPAAGVASAPGTAASGASTAAPGATPLPSMVYFDVGSARLDAEAGTALANVAAYLAARPEVVVEKITGHTDKTGSHSKNVVLAKERAKAVRNGLFDQGVRNTQVVMSPPANVTGGVDDSEARRVDINLASAGAAGAATPPRAQR